MKKATILAAAVLALASCGGKGDYEYAFQNPRLSNEKRVENLISLLTPQEKIGLMMNGSISIDRLGIPAYNWWSEACHGIQRPNSTVFPEPIALAATFDEPQQYDIFTAVSDEARATWNTTDHNRMGKTEATGEIGNTGLSYWCPNVNIFRDPRWGRGMETCGEDPYLAGVLGAATVRGMQGDDDKYFKTHACVKHYAVHSGPEKYRHSFDITVSMRDLWETYLPAFKTIVKDAKVQEVMCAYNRYEGIPCCGSERLLTNILREKWGFDKIILSDCKAINDFYLPDHHGTSESPAHASADAVLAGTDLECGLVYNNLIEAMEKGLIKESQIDESLRRILLGRFELGMFDPEENMPWAGLGADDISSPEHTALALKAANESMVLLKNDGILPLSKDIRKIAIVGPNADNAGMHNGNYNGQPKRENSISILNAIRQAVPGAEIIYDRACELADPNLTERKVMKINNGKGMHAAFYNNTDFSGSPVITGDYPNVNFRTYGGYRFAEGVDDLNFSTRLTGKYTAEYTGEITYSIRATGTYRFYVDGKLLSEQIEKPGPAFNRDIAPDFTFPIVAGRSYDLRLDYTKGSEGSAYLQFEFNRKYPATFEALAQNVKDADVILVVSGLSSRIEGEEMQVPYDGFSGGDRTKIELPKVQRDLLEAMYGTGKPVVLINCSGGAIGFGEVEHEYNALLQAWYAGQATGLAVAETLFGDNNPAGRLPVTFYKSTDQLPEDFYDYSMEGKTYRYFRGEPLYPFGYGLSYTTFDYGDAALSSSSIKAGKSVKVTIPVKNTGSVDGDEVVQVYVKSLDNPDAPIKSLKGFRRVTIPAGSSTSVEITLDKTAFEFYEESIDELAVRKGSYQILYGSSSADKDLKVLPLKVI